MMNLLNNSKVRLRRPSIGTIEANGLNMKGMVDLNEFDDADAELAANFGYKPVFKRVNKFILELISEDPE